MSEVWMQPPTEWRDLYERISMTPYLGNYRSLRVCSSYDALGRGVALDSDPFGAGMHCYKYLLWCNGFMEVFDLTQDFAEINNLAAKVSNHLFQSMPKQDVAEVNNLAATDLAEINNLATTVSKRLLDRFDALLSVLATCHAEACWKPFNFIHSSTEEPPVWYQFQIESPFSPSLDTKTVTEETCPRFKQAMDVILLRSSIDPLQAYATSLYLNGCSDVTAWPYPNPESVIYRAYLLVTPSQWKYLQSPRGLVHVDFVTQVGVACGSSFKFVHLSHPGGGIVFDVDALLSSAGRRNCQN
eukprot:gene16868-23138_t